MIQFLNKIINFKLIYKLLNKYNFFIIIIFLIIFAQEIKEKEQMISNERETFLEKERKEKSKKLSKPTSSPSSSSSPSPTSSSSDIFSSSFKIGEVGGLGSSLPPMEKLNSLLLQKEGEISALQSQIASLERTRGLFGR
jgi:hypothetical protein